MHIVELLFQADSTSNLEVGKSVDLRFAQQVSIQGIDVLTLQTFVNIDDMFEFLQEPLVNLRQFMNLINGIFGQVHRLGNDEDTLVGRLAQGRIDIRNFQFLVLHIAVHALPYHAQTFLDSLLEVATDSHYLAHTLHR